MWEGRKKRCWCSTASIALEQNGAHRAAAATAKRAKLGLEGASCSLHSSVTLLPIYNRTTPD